MMKIFILWVIPFLEKRFADLVAAGAAGGFMFGRKKAIQKAEIQMN